MNIDSRVQKLEKQNEALSGQIKNLKKMLGGVAAIALAALIGGTVLGVHAAKPLSNKFNNLYANRIFLRDKAGNIRVSIHGQTGNLNVFDKNKKVRVNLNGNQAIVSVRDSVGKPRVLIRGNDGVLFLRGPSKKMAASLHSKNGAFYLHDTNGKVRVRAHGNSGSVVTFKAGGGILHVLGKGPGPHKHPVAKHAHSGTANVTVK